MSKNHYKRAIAIIDELIGAVEKRQKLDVGQNDWNHWSDLTRKLNDLCAKVNRWGRPTELPIWSIPKNDRDGAYVVSPTEFPLWKQQILDLREKFGAAESELKP